MFLVCHSCPLKGEKMFFYMTPLVTLQQLYMRSITTPDVFFKLLEVEPEQDQEGRPKNKEYDVGGFLVYLG